MPRTRRRKRREAEDLDVGPLMNLFVAIVPMLLLSAVFVTLTHIDLSMGGAAATQPHPLTLSLRLTPQEWQVQVQGQTSARFEPGDVAALGRELEALHAAHPGQSSILVACAETVEYAEVVRVLDVAALAGFVDCALAGIVPEAGDAAAVGAAPAAPAGAPGATIPGAAAGRTP